MGSLPNSADIKNDLAAMATADIEVKSVNKFKVWLARSSAEQQVGLMNVREDEMPIDRGMLFIFDEDRYQSFWMRNTIIPLDIAYIRSDGTIVKTHTMKALDESGYPSIEPARFALELRAGQLAARGIARGDHVRIPDSVFNSEAPPSDERP